MKSKSPSQVRQKNMKTGVIYVYENQPYWCKEKKQGRATRKCIGILDETNNTIVPTRGRTRKPLESTESFPVAKRKFYGATYLLDAIGEKLGIIDDLKYCFPAVYKQILSLAYYLILDDSSSMSRFERWSNLYKHPFGKHIPSQRISELLASITESAKTKFFRLQGKRRAENEYWAYDITSISSYSEMLKQVKYGNNKEGDSLPQINFALVYGDQSELPFYYMKLAGNIPDVKTVKPLLKELSVMGFTDVKLSMDRGFYSESNINDLYKERIKFLIATKTSLSYIRTLIDDVYDDMRSFQNFNPDNNLYAVTVPAEWEYTQKRSYKGDTLKEKKRIFVHIYYNHKKASDEEQNFDKLLITLRNELLSGKRFEKNEKLYDKYFIVSKDNKGDFKVSAQDDVIKKKKRYCGYFVLLSNEVDDTWKALSLYRNKDVVEKAFCNIKDRLDLRRMSVSTEKTLDGKLFVGFIALILLSYINKQMREKSLYKDHTMQDLFDQLDAIEHLEYEGKKPWVSVVLEKQKKIYENLEVNSL